jgi:hypothetical protein
MSVTLRAMSGPIAIVLFVLGSIESSAQSGPAASGLGTPEGTAELAGRLGFLDVAGIKLGMSAAEAIAALKALNSSFEISIGRTCPNTQTCDDSVSPIHGIRAADDRTYEQVLVEITPPPSRGFVSAISRRLQFDQGSQPPVESVVESLRKKYGPETANPETTVISLGIQPFDQSSFVMYRWMFDAQGDLIPWPKDAKAETAMHYCGYGLGSAHVEVTDIVVPDLGDENARRAGPPPMDTSLCAGTRVDVGIGVTQNGLVQSLEVVIGNRTLQDSAWTSTWKWSEQNVLNELQKDRARGSAVPVPTL